MGYGPLVHSKGPTLFWTRIIPELYRLPLNAGQKLTFIKLPFSIKTFVLPFFTWLFKPLDRFYRIVKYVSPYKPSVFLWDICMQCRPRSDAAKCDV